MEYKTREENYQEALIEARGMSVQEIKKTLRERMAYHEWYVIALETALAEKGTQWTRQGRSILARLQQLLCLTGRCQQGCGKRLRKEQQFFCSDLCRYLYTPATFGQGRGILVQLRASLWELRREREP